MFILPKSEAWIILSDPSRSELDRMEAVRSLAQIRDAECIEHLIYALEDEVFGVRWTAAIELSQLRPRDLLPLLRVVEDPPRIANPRLREGLVRVLHNHKDQLVRSASIELEYLLRSSEFDLPAVQAAVDTLRAVLRI